MEQKFKEYTQAPENEGYYDEGFKVAGISLRIELGRPKYFHNSDDKNDGRRFHSVEKLVGKERQSKYKSLG